MGERKINILFPLFAKKSSRIYEKNRKKQKKTVGLREKDDRSKVNDAVKTKNGGVCEPISAPLFMRGEPTHRSFFAAISCDKNRNLCDISAEKRE